MLRKLTTEEFVAKANAKHGDRYDYSQTVYRNSRKPVTIACPEHGPFSQTPSVHLAGSGCRACTKAKTLSTDEFIQNAKEVHGERYDYSDVEYVNRTTKVTIVCRDHGPFTQLPHNHIGRRSGCPECVGLKKLTADKFVERARQIHGNRYDYSLAKIKNTKTPVTIICPDHGPFRQTPNEHLYQESGCVACAGLKKGTSESFIEKARRMHGDRYDYSQAQYVNTHTPVTIICRDHGPFLQTPASHTSRGSGCLECTGLKSLTTSEFIKRAQDIHGDRYDYSQAEYVNNRTHVTIICPDHGPFSQTPNKHLGGQGCRDCASYGYNANDPAVLYYVAIHTDDGDTRYKIGITNRTVEERFIARDWARVRVVKTWRFATGRAAAAREAEILNRYAGDKYYGPDILQSGNTELFTHDILELDRQ